MSYPIKITAQVTNEYIDQIVESAGTGCAGWADEGEIVRDSLGAVESYTLKWFDGRSLDQRALKPRTIAGAIEKILDPCQTIVSKRIVGYIQGLDEINVDDEVADAIIQIAIFGEIVYG